jgi:hypothetical protein
LNNSYGPRRQQIFHRQQPCGELYHPPWNAAFADFALGRSGEAQQGEAQWVMVLRLVILS